MRILQMSVCLALALALTGCEPERVQITAGPAGYAGRHVG